MTNTAGADEQEIARLMAAVATETDARRILSKLFDAAREQDSPVAAALIELFFQQVVIERGGKAIPPEWRDPMGEPSKSLPPARLELLRSVSDHPTATPAVVAQIGHFTWSTEKQSKELRRYAERALAALVHILDDSSIEDFERIGIAVRALHLAKLLGRKGEADATRSSLLQIADDALDADDGSGTQKPGVTLHALLQYRHYRGDPEERLSRLERAAIVYDENRHIASEIAELRAAVAATKSEKDALIRPIIRRLLSESSDEPGFLRQNSLSIAMQLARKYGLKDLQGLVAQALSKLTVDDYDLKTTTTSTPWPDGYVEARLRDFAPERTPTELLRAISSAMPVFLPPAERPPRPAGLVDLASESSINLAGHVDFVGTTQAERERMRVRHDDMLLFKVEANFLFEGLRALRERADAVEELRARIRATDLFTELGKARVERALEAFLADDWDVVLDTLPSFEAGVRTLALGLGVSIYSPQGEANKFKTLGGLLDEIADRYSGRVWSTIDYWRFVTVDQMGLNIRNNYLHGLVDQGTPVTASVLIHLFIQLLTLVTRTDASATQDSEGAPPPPG